MRRLLKFELKKVWGKRLFWGLFLLAFLLNVIMLWWVNKGDTYTPVFNDYKSVYNALRPLDNADKLQYLQKEKGILDAISQKESLGIDRANDPDSPFTKSEEKQYTTVYRQYKNILDQKQDYRQAERKSTVVNEAMSGLKIIMGYSAYLNGIRKNASILQASSIFSGQSTDSFPSRNIQKTLADYVGMDTVRPQYDIDKGVNIILNFPATDIFILIIIFFTCLSLVTDEKDKGLLALVKATKGGTGQTIAAKLTALFILAFSVTALAFASAAVFAQASYGLGDLSRAVQSLPDMIGSTLRLNVGQYLLLNFAVKAIGLTIIGMIILLFAILAKHPIMVIVQMLFTAAASICLYLFIPITSGFNWLKVLNPVCLASPNRVLSKYYNLNFFGKPVNMIPVFLIFMALLLALLIVADSLAFVKSKSLSSSRLSFKAFLCRTKIFQPHVHSHFAWYEVRKIACINLAALILVLFALFQWLSTKNDSISLTANDYYYRHYMVMLAGKLTATKETYLQTEKAKYDNIHTDIQKLSDKYRTGKISWEDKISQENSYNNILVREMSFTEIYNRYIYIKAHPGTQFVYDLGYERLFGVTDPDNGLDSGTKLVIVLILCLCGVFSMEYRTGMYKVLGTTQKGAKSTVLCKLLISIAVAALIYVCAYLPDIILTGQTYGFNELSASLASLPSFESFSHFSILGYIVLLFTTRLIISFAVTCMILVFSLLIKNNVYAALVSLCVFVGPPLLNMVGIHLFDHTSLIPMLTTNTYYLDSQGNIVAILQITVGVLLTLFSLLLLFKRFGKAKIFKR